MTRSALHAKASQTTSGLNKCKLFEGTPVTSGTNIRFRLANKNLDHSKRVIRITSAILAFFAGKIIFYRVLYITVHQGSKKRAANGQKQAIF